MPLYKIHVMHYRLLFLMMSLVHFSRAQHFTKGQVYDFQEGDVFQTEYAIGTSVQSGPIEYRIDSIVQVHYKYADSMAYDTKVTRFFRMANWPAGVYSDPETQILTIRVNNLSDTLFHDISWCQPYQGTIYEYGIIAMHLHSISPDYLHVKDKSIPVLNTY